MTPTPLAALIASDPLAAWQAAIVARLQLLLPGVTVKAHPGKISMSQIESKTIVSAPGIAVGWSRIRSTELIDGAADLTVEWIAYVVAEDKVIDNARVERERIGFALGRQLLLILADYTASNWGLTRIRPPEAAPAPQISPVYTVSDQAEATSYLAVVWTQTIIDQGTGLYTGPLPVLTAVDDDEGRASINADFEPGDVPEDIRALWREVDP